jgi:oligopeptide transport system permease protein
MSMWSLLARRLLQFPLVIAVVFVLTFLLISTAPGDPLLSGDQAKVPEEVLAQQRAKFRLDQPWYRRAWAYAEVLGGSAWHGRLDLGVSIPYKGRPVAEILGLTAETWAGGAFRTSLTLGLLALAAALLIGVHLGVLAGAHQNRLADHLTMGLSVVGVSLPTFVTGALFIWLLALELHLLPAGGWGDLDQLVLPALTLALPFAAYIARLMRASVLDVLGADYIRTARAKGLSERQVVYRHAFKLALLPVLSFLGPAAASVLTGSFVVEQLFNVPGIGRHFVQSVLNRDPYLVMGTVLLYAVLLVTFNLLVDIGYLFVDPRISREEAV